MKKFSADVSAADQTRIEKLGVEFETHCKQNLKPEIEVFLKKEPRLREPLLRKLLTVEIRVHRSHGQNLKKEDYLARFPDVADYIDQIFKSDSHLIGEENDDERETVEHADETMPKKQSKPLIDDETAGLTDPAKSKDSSIDRFVDSQSTVNVTGVFHFDEISSPDETKVYSPGKNASMSTVPGHVGGSSDLPTIQGYKITREIARGGMGRVLAGHDLALDREVAIKILLPSSSSDAASRFVTESKVTARLPHPGVPPVHALGSLNDGAPYLAMKLVDGKDLAELLRERESTSIDLSRWIGVFEQVCQAVGFAHSQGILHRDLKPANVMVGGFGEVHVMDWGLAKDLRQTKGTSSLSDINADDSGQTGFERPNSQHSSVPPSMTADGQVMGTPQYMAPEQARGEVVDARADVFALGGILSAILTGRPPFTGTTTFDVLKNSAAGNTTEVERRLDSCGADAELIDLARRCLAPAPDDRPLDGQKVAEAVAEYLAGVAVRLQEAQAERAAAQARAVEQRKRRHIWVVAASIVIGVLIAGGSAALWQWIRAEDALTQVTTEQQKTLEALDDLTASRDRNVRNLRLVTKQLVPDFVGRTRKLTESDQSFIRGLLPMWKEIASARGESLEALELRAEGLFAVAKIQESLGQFAEAELVYQKALKTYSDLSVKIPDDPNRQQSVARVHNNLSNTLVDLGESNKALTEMRLALAIQEKLAIKYPEIEQYQGDLARSHLNIGNQLGSVGKEAEAQQQYQSALDILERLTRKQPAKGTNLSVLAGVHANLGNSYRRLGKVPKTLEQYQAAVKLYEDLAGRYPDEIEYRKNFGVIRSNLGAILFEAGELPKSEEQYRKALAVRKELVSTFPSISEYRSELVQTLNNLAVLLAAAKKPAEAQKHYSSSVELLKGLLEQSPDAPQNRALLASTYDNLGLLLGDQTWSGNQPLEAEKQHRAALVIWKGLQTEFPDNLNYSRQAADCRNHLGLLLTRQGRIGEADEFYIDALEVREDMVKRFPNNPEYQRSLAGGYCNIGNLVTKRGQLNDGLNWFDKAVTLLEPRVQSEPKDTRARQFLRNSYWSRAGVNDKLGQTDEATIDWDKAINLSPAREQIILKQFRADSRARAGLVEEAIDTVESIAPILKWPPNNLYNFACTCAISSEKTTDAEQKKVYADKAMKMLQQAVKAGWKDAEKIATDPDLVSLRDRDDFRQLLVELND